MAVISDILPAERYTNGVTGRIGYNEERQTNVMPLFELTKLTAEDRLGASIILVGAIP